tara:strand:- start:5654 stop:5860 length:207 start_codon:yes stop_codon:yes gene_type:complete
MTSRKIPLEDEKKHREECFFRVGGKLFHEGPHTVDELVDKIDRLQEQLEEKDLMISSLRKKIAEAKNT